MVYDVLSLHKFHIVDLAGSLHPLESVLVRELHSLGHGLVSALNQSLSGKLRIVAPAHEHFLRQRWQLYVLAILSLSIEIRCVQISFIVIVIARFDTKNRILAGGPLQIAATPAVLRAVRLTNALKPGIDRFVVELDTVVRGRFKFVGVEVLDNSSLPSGTDGLLSRLTSSEDFDMHHAMLLSAQLRVVVNGTVEDQITGLHLFERHIDWKRVILVSLVPSIQFESEVFSQVENYLADERAAVKKDRRVVKRFALFVISLGIWNAEVLFATFNKLLPQLSLELRIPPVDRSLLCHVVPVFDLICLGLAEPSKVGL